MELGIGALAVRAYSARREALAARATSTRLCATIQTYLAARTPPRPSSWTTRLRTDGQGLIVAVDADAARWLRLPPQQLVGMPLLHLVGRRDTRAFRGFVKGLGYALAPTVADLRMRPRHGAPARVRASVARVAPNMYEWTLDVFEE